jgi:hypothetical protein
MAFFAGKALKSVTNIHPTTIIWELQIGFRYHYRPALKLQVCGVKVTLFSGCKKKIKAISITGHGGL